MPPDKMACTRYKYMKMLFRHPQAIHRRNKELKFRDELFVKHQDRPRLLWFYQLPLNFWSCAAFRTDRNSSEETCISKDSNINVANKDYDLLPMDQYLFKCKLFEVSRSEFLEATNPNPRGKPHNWQSYINSESKEFSNFDSECLHFKFNEFLSQLFCQKNNYYARNHDDLDARSMTINYEDSILQASWRRYGWHKKNFKAHHAALDHIDCQIDDKLDFLIKSPARHRIKSSLRDKYLNIINDLDRNTRNNLVDDQSKSRYDDFKYTPIQMGLSCRPSKFMNNRGERNTSVLCNNILSISLHDTWRLLNLANAKYHNQIEQDFLSAASLRQAFAISMCEANLRRNFDMRHFTCEPNIHGDIEEPLVSFSLALSQNQCVFSLFYLNTMRLDIPHEVNNRINFCLQYKINADDNGNNSDTGSKKFILENEDFQIMLGHLIDQDLSYENSNSIDETNNRVISSEKQFKKALMSERSRDEVMLNDLKILNEKSIDSTYHIIGGKYLDRDKDFSDRHEYHAYYLNI